MNDPHSPARAHAPVPGEQESPVVPRSGGPSSGGGFARSSDPFEIVGTLARPTGRTLSPLTNAGSPSSADEVGAHNGFTAATSARHGLGLGLGLPVALDELLEAGEAFSGFGAAAAAATASMPSSESAPCVPSAAMSPPLPPSPPTLPNRPPRSVHRPLSASTTSTASTSGSPPHSSPQTDGGGRRAGRWSAASTAATSLHYDEELQQSPHVEKRTSPSATSTVHVVDSPAQVRGVRSARSASSLDKSSGDAPASFKIPPPSHSATSFRPTHTPRRPCDASASSASPHASSGSPRSHRTLLSPYAHPRVDPPPCPPRTAPAPEQGQRSAWAPPADLDEEERLVLSLMPISPPDAGIFAGAEGLYEAKHVGEGGAGPAWWERGAQRRELGRSPSPARAPSAHPFATPANELPAAPPQVAISRPPEAPTRWATISAGSPPTLSSSTGSYKRASMLSTLASPFASLSRSRNTGGGSGLAPPSAGGGGVGERRRDRLSVIGEASTTPASSAPSSSAASLASSSSRTSGISATLAALSPGGRAHEYAAEEHLPASLRAQEMVPPSAPSKAAKLLGLGLGVESPAVSTASAPASPRVRPSPPLEAAPRFSPLPVPFVDVAVDETMGRGEAQEENGLPRWPARREELQELEVLSADIYKLTSTPTSLFRSSRALFRPRFVALTCCSSPPGSPACPTAYYLHAFKSRHPSERETSRLQLLPSSVVCVPAPLELPHRAKDRRAFAVKITGRARVDSAGWQRVAEVGWVVGMDDEGVFREWLARLKSGVAELRRAGEGAALPPLPIHADAEPFDLDAARRAADEVIRERSASAASGIGNLVLTSHGWQVEGAAEEGSSLRGGTRGGRSHPPTASSSWTMTSRKSVDDVDASSFSGGSSVYSRGDIRPPASTAPTTAGYSFLDADSSGDESVVEEGRLEAPSSFTAPCVRSLPTHRRASGQSSAGNRESAYQHAHLAPPLPPPAAALPPLPPHPPHRSSRHSFLSSHSAESLPPPRPPPKGRLPPVPPSPDLAQLEREMAQTAYSAQEHDRAA